MAEPTQEIKVWLERGAQIRAALVEERQRLATRIIEIDAALASLGYAHPEPPVARQVVAVLEAAGKPLRVAEIRSALPGVQRLAIGSALHALSKRGEIVPLGRNGARTYAFRS